MYDAVPPKKKKVEFEDIPQEIQDLLSELPDELKDSIKEMQGAAGLLGSGSNSLNPLLTQVQDRLREIVGDDENDPTTVNELLEQMFGIDGKDFTKLICRMMPEALIQGDAPKELSHQMGACKEVRMAIIAVCFTVFMMGYQHKENEDG